MELNEMNIPELEKRFAEIKEIVASRSDEMTTEELETLTKEITSLEERKIQLNKKIEERAALIEKAKTSTNVIEKPEERGKNMDEILTRDQVLASKEYRSAFFKKLAGETLDEAELRFTSTTVNFGGSLPVETAKQIFSNIEEQHPILGDITLYRTGSVFEISLHNAIAAGDAAIVAQGVANADEENTFAKVTLSGKDFSKHVEISYALSKMNGQALEQYLVQEISERLGAALAKEVVTQVTADTHADNKKTSAAVKVTTFVELNGLFALLKQAKGKAVYCNEFTLYSYLTSIVDTTGRPIFQPSMQDGVAGMLLGSPVKVEDAVADNVFLIGAPKKVVGNMVQDIMIESDRDIKRHVDIFSGYARFECKLTNAKSFVIFTMKLV